jgi:eukaryotic-like serine/threonine-protein kinase
MVSDDDDNVATALTVAEPSGAPRGAGDAAARTQAAPRGSASAQTQVASAGDVRSFELPPPGYELGALLGKGGMGEVVIAHDLRVGREVAYKRMRDSNADGEALGRFLREARIQARLDHPAIVPVYELGKDADGRPYFTMKRLTGKTLSDRLADRSEPRQPLLRAFAEVCLAIELAHSKGVIHRDLKPQNIMLGDYGEVYVLDWGIARVIGDRRARRATGADQGDIDTLGEATSDGTMLGTLGYMSPEQMRGEDVGPPTDVYALGAILFEILTDEPLHPRGHAAVASTLAMDTASPRERTPDRAIAPELDQVCTEALRSDAAKRPTARELASRVQRYLDGDRDLERRRQLAAEYLAAARVALASGDADRRAEATRTAGRALSLDPESAEAAELVTALIVEPPRRLPADLQDLLQANETELARRRAGKAVSAVLSVLSLSFALLVFEVKSWAWLGVLWLGLLAFAALSWRTSRTGRAHVWPVLVGTVLIAVAFARVVSPYILVPSLLCGTVLAISNSPVLNERRWILYAWMACAASLPSLLEMTGLIEATARVVDDMIVIDSAVLDGGGDATRVALSIANLILLLAIARFAVMLARDRRAAQRSVMIQAWHLRQLLPKDAAAAPARASQPAASGE